MEDRSYEIFNQYDLKIYNTYRARGALLLDTDQGLKLYRECDGREKRLEFEDMLKKHITEHGYKSIDCFVRNRAGTIISANSIGEHFIIKNWFDGDECNLKKEDKTKQAAVNLAELHLCMQGVASIQEQQFFGEQDDLIDLFDKRTRELKRVKNYIRGKNQKNNFEVQYLNICEEFYQEALQAIEELKHLPYIQMKKDAIDQGMVCHGNYTYHNLLVLKEAYHSDKMLYAAEFQSPEAIATTNFDKAVFGLQIVDVYQFIRKVMEKNDWDISLGKRILEEYQKVRPCEPEERQLLYVMLLYPEKFWKITNCYYNNKKSWIPQKNVQKLFTLKQQMFRKQLFLQELI